MNITFDSAGLLAVRQAGQCVTMAKRVDIQVGPFLCASSLYVVGPQPVPIDVVWQSFTPLEVNLVTWDSTYFAIASSMTPEIGKTIFINAKSEARLGSGFIYEDGQISQDVACDTGKIAITNRSQDVPLSFGLAQTAAVNGQTHLFPICIVAILGAETAIFKPSPEAKVFLSSNIEQGGIIPRLRTMAEFSSDSDVVYDDKSASFHEKS